MRILVTGASGFIGGHLFARLRRAGHAPVAAVRDRDGFRRRWPDAEAVACDFNRDTDPAVWEERLVGIDAVVNASGVLRGGRGQNIEAIHHLTPRALFTACAEAGVRRVVQVSALGAEYQAATEFARTKERADDFLLGRDDLQGCVVQPSLVYAQGSHGGTSLFRALAALPFVMPAVGDGNQLFQPVHMDDVTEGILRLLERETAPPRARIAMVGAEPVAVREILRELRRWLGLRPAPVLGIPLWLCRMAARVGDVAGGPLNSTSFRMMNYGNTADPAPFREATGISPRAFAEGLAAMPAQVQDRWHARLYPLKPLLRIALALVWIVAGIVSLRPEAITGYAALADPLGLGLYVGEATVVGLAVIDLAIGLALLAAWRVRAVGLFALAVMIGYTAALSVLQPALWLDPFGPLIKNVPLAVGLLVTIVLEEGR